MQVNPPRYIQGDSWHDPRIPRDPTYWPPGLPRGAAGAIDLLRCDARSYDYWEGKRREMVGEPPLTEPTFMSQRLSALADLLEADSAEMQRRASGPIPRQRKAS